MCVSNKHPTGTIATVTIATAVNYCHYSHSSRTYCVAAQQRSCTHVSKHYRSKQGTTVTLVWAIVYRVSLYGTRGTNPCVRWPRVNYCISIQHLFLPVFTFVYLCLPLFAQVQGANLKLTKVLGVNLKLTKVPCANLKLTKVLGPS